MQDNMSCNDSSCTEPQNSCAGQDLGAQAPQLRLPLMRVGALNRVPVRTSGQYKYTG